LEKIWKEAVEGDLSYDPNISLEWLRETQKNFTQETELRDKT
jgi:hypothetical protein